MTGHRKGVEVARTRVTTKRPAVRMRMELTNEWQRDSVSARLRKLPMDAGQQYVVEVRSLEHERSLEQNRRYWAIVGELATAMGLGKDRVHEVLKRALLGFDTFEHDGKVYEVTRSTSSLTTKQFFEYTESVCDWAAERYGLVFS